MRNRRSPINRINHINSGKSKKIALCLFLVFVTLAASLFTSCGNTPQSGVDTQSGTKDTVPTLDVPLDTFERPAPETEAEPEEIFSASFVACGDNIIYYGNVRDAAALAVPNGRKYNVYAGCNRNRQMAEYAVTGGAYAVLALFWNGKSKGSMNMKSEAKKHGMKIFEKVIERME